MADKGFQLNVLTEEKAVIDRVVLSLIAPGSEGDLGLLRDHASLVTGLRPGKLTVTDLTQESREFAVSGGFLEVNRNIATILADALEPVEDIDLERARSAAERARKRLESLVPEVDKARAEAALVRAKNRIRLKARV